MTTDQLKSFNLQFITHSNSRFSAIDGARLALEGGCRWIQLRLKGADAEAYTRAASVLLPLCRQVGAVFIIDDMVDVCKAVGADGVHLGKNDMDPRAARSILGPDFIIGATCNTFDDVSAVAGCADYIGCGPFRFTTTKQNLAPVLGLEGYRQIVWQMRSNNINIPLVAIGGITLADVGDILSAGPDGIAMSGEILNAVDPVAQAQAVVGAILAHPNRSFLSPNPDCGI